ncbi:hypothetical protein E2562_018639 [Oryza meyeriana var. granulata]|uniref:Uncharacterized protein n=1 Tax=Oryza meyeriana var. granulata TaxID=110450 RepID=A0A6G1BXH8_9ORYZ|nr:hypothetical protein E2562_018639 [Oryza meyeriana var. granulata]
MLPLGLPLARPRATHASAPHGPRMPRWATEVSFIEENSAGNAAAALMARLALKTSALSVATHLSGLAWPMLPPM